MSTKKLVVRVIICAFLIPILVVPFISIFSLQSNVGTLEKYGMFASYNATPFTLLGKNLQTFWMTANNALVILLFIAAIIYIILFILDYAKVDIKNAEKIVKYLGVLILVLSILAVITGLIATLVNDASSSNTFVKIHGEPGYFLQLFPIVSGILAVIPLHEE